MLRLPSILHGPPKFDFATVAPFNVPWPTVGNRWRISEKQYLLEISFYFYLIKAECKKNWVGSNVKCLSLCIGHDSSNLLIRKMLVIYLSIDIKYLQSQCYCSENKRRYFALKSHTQANYYRVFASNFLVIRE